MVKPQLFTHKQQLNVVRVAIKNSCRDFCVQYQELHQIKSLSSSINKSKINFKQPKLMKISANRKWEKEDSDRSCQLDNTYKMCSSCSLLNLIRNKGYMMYIQNKNPNTQHESADKKREKFFPSIGKFVYHV